MMRARGFTLIELLVVLAIIGLSISIVGPLAIEQLDKFKSQDQVVQLERWVKALKHQAFINDTSYRLRLNNKTAELIEQQSEQLISQRRFSLLNFEPQELSINKNGFMFPDTITLTSRERQLILEFENHGIQPQD